MSYIERLTQARLAMGLEAQKETTKALELQSISFNYGTKSVLRSVSLNVAAGEIVSLVGPSGCGKSTLLRIAAGLENIQKGQVLINGTVVAQGGQAALPPEQRGVGLVFQDFALFPHLTVEENVRFGLNKISRSEQSRRIIETLELVNMMDHAASYPHQLSGGQQQRIALARALAPEPNVMLMDEPFSGLDPRLRSHVRDETLHALKRAGIGVLIVTHDPEEAMFMSDRIALVSEGHILQIGSPVDLYQRPNCHFATEFFGDVNILRGTVMKGAVKTPLGIIPCRDLPDDLAVDVLIRPEALKLDILACPAHTEDGLGTVQAARMLGRYCMIHMSVAQEGQKPPLHIHARVPGLFLPPENSTVRITLERDHVFVFPTTSVE